MPSQRVGAARGRLTQEGLPGPDGSPGRVASYCNLTANPAGVTLLEEAQVVLTFRKAYTGDLRVYSKLQAENIHGRSDELMGTITINGKTSDLTDVSGLGLSTSVWANGSSSPQRARRREGDDRAGHSSQASSSAPVGPPPAKLGLGAPTGRHGLGSCRTRRAMTSRPSTDESDVQLGHVRTEPASASLQGSRHDLDGLDSTDRASASTAPKGRSRTTAAYVLRPQPDPSLPEAPTQPSPAHLHLYCARLGLPCPPRADQRERADRRPLPRLPPGRVGQLPDLGGRGETVPIVVDRTAGESAVLSGIFLGGRGA